MALCVSGIYSTDATSPRPLRVIEQWFSVRTDLDLQGTCQCLETLLMATMVRKKECNYSLVGRIQGHWETAHYRDSAQNQETAPNHALNKKSCLGDFTVGVRPLIMSAQTQAAVTGHLALCSYNPNTQMRSLCFLTQLFSFQQ